MNTLPFALIIFIIALVVFWGASRKQSQTGLPSGRVIYNDTRAWGESDKPLFDPVYDITGKPDYLVKEHGVIIPVEVKTSRTPNSPYDSHVFQLAAYCMLVQRTYGTRPPYGIIKYPHRTFSVDYTQALENELIELIADIRIQQRKKNVPRSHNSPARCAGCGYRELCDDRL